MFFVNGRKDSSHVFNNLKTNGTNNYILTEKIGKKIYESSCTTATKNFSLCSECPMNV